MMGRSSMPKQMMTKGGMAKKKMNMGGMAKMPMMQEGGDVDKVPTKEEFDAMTPKQQADRKKAAMMQNLNLTPKEKADKKAMERKDIFKNMGGPAVSSAKKAVKTVKNMNMGGMATANKYDRNRIEKRAEKKPPEVPRFDRTRVPVEPSPTPPGMKKGGVAKKMNMGGMAKASYSKGSKVRGYGMARGGKACKMR